MTIGHGIGSEFHEEPQILHYGKPATGIALKEGMTFTIEPMLNARKHTTKLKPDGGPLKLKMEDSHRNGSIQWW